MTMVKQIKAKAEYKLGLTLSWRRSLPYRNQSIDLQSKSVDWFLYDRDFLNERVNNEKAAANQSKCNLIKHKKCSKSTFWMTFVTYQLKVNTHWIKSSLILELIWDHSFSAYAKFSEKLTFLTPWYARVSVRDLIQKFSYQVIVNDSKQISFL